MFAKKIMEKPILAIGIIMFSVFIWNTFYKDKTTGGSHRFSTQSCKAVVVKLSKAIPKTWSAECERNSLIINIDMTIALEKTKAIKPAMYRSLANNLQYVAKNSPVDTMERVKAIILKLHHENMVLKGLTTGKEIVKLTTIQNPKFIAEHLKASVQVVEENK